MRMLTTYEVSLVAGGTSSSDYYPDGAGGPFGDGSGYGEGSGDSTGGPLSGYFNGFFIWVNDSFGPAQTDSFGNTIVTGASHWEFVPYSGSGEAGYVGGGQGDITAAVANATPCVETSFAATNVDLATVNNAALAASNAIASLNDETYEYSSIIWELNGAVGWTLPYTDHDPDEVNWTGNLSQVPDGAVIVGIVHNHPDDPIMNDTIPSGSGQENGQDWDSYNTLVNWNDNHPSSTDLPRGITVDHNMLLYIYSDQDHKTHVYDNTDKNQTSTSCSLQ